MNLIAGQIERSQWDQPIQASNSLDVVRWKVKVLKVDQSVEVFDSLYVVAVKIQREQVGTQLQFAQTTDVRVNSTNVFGFHAATRLFATACQHWIQRQLLLLWCMKFLHGRTITHLHCEENDETGAGSAYWACSTLTNTFSSEKSCRNPQHHLGSSRFPKWRHCKWDRWLANSDVSREGEEGGGGGDTVCFDCLVTCFYITLEKQTVRRKNGKKMTNSSIEGEILRNSQFVFRPWPFTL